MKAIITTPRKAFYRQRIQQFRCGRKDAIDIDIRKTSRSGDRTIMQPVKITIGPVTRTWHF